jgi:hypothetical protein
MKLTLLLLLLILLSLTALSLPAFAQTSVLLPTTAVCPAPQITVISPTAALGTYTVMAVSCLSYDATVTLTTSTKTWTMTAASGSGSGPGPGTPYALVIPEGGFFVCNGPTCLTQFLSIQFTYKVTAPTAPGPCPNITSSGTSVSQATGAYAVDTAGYLYFCSPQVVTNGSLGPPPQWMRTTVPMVSTW